MKSKHPLINLRKILGIHQKELAGMISCSVFTIQSIETNRLKMSESLAQRVSNETNVSVQWLLGDSSAPPKARSGREFTKDMFEKFRAERLRPKDDLWDVFNFHHAAAFQFSRIASLVLFAYRQNELSLFEYKFSKAMDLLEKEFIKKPYSDPMPSPSMEETTLPLHDQAFRIGERFTIALSKIFFSKARRIDPEQIAEWREAGFLKDPPTVAKGAVHPRRSSKK